MLENLRRQEESYPLFNNGSSMPASVKASTLEVLQELEGMYFGDKDAIEKFGNHDYWVNVIADGMLSISNPSQCSLRDAGDVIEGNSRGKNDCHDNIAATPPIIENINDGKKTLSATTLKESIASRGFHVSSPPSQSSSTENTGLDTDHLSMAIAQTLESLRSKGWPPQFLLLYDEIWMLLKQTCEGDEYQSFFAVKDDNNNERIILEPDVNIWSLRKPDDKNDESCSSEGRYIGGNFVHPHRDMIYSACHDVEDCEAATALSVWIPLNLSGATESNGCMRVVPIENDDFFYSPLHPRHVENAAHYGDNVAVDNAVEDSTIKHVKIVCPQFGSTAWDPTCIHWGGACEPNAVEEPRTSLAFTIRQGSAKRSEFSVNVAKRQGNKDDIQPQSQQTGPSAVSVCNAEKGGMKRRLQVVAKALLSYSHHWPGMPFDGFQERLKIGTREIER